LPPPLVHAAHNSNSVTNANVRANVHLLKRFMRKSCTSRLECSIAFTARAEGSPCMRCGRVLLFWSGRFALSETDSNLQDGYSVAIVHFKVSFGRCGLRPAYE
jgi:hypothetical protein